MTIHSPAELRVGDTVRVIPKPFVGTVQKLTSDDQVIVDGTWHHAGKFEFELIDRPEPPKPAAKVGDKLTGAVVEPPLGAVARRVTSGWGGAAAIGNLRVRTEDGWLLVKGGTPTTDKLLEYNRLDSNGYVLASLPE